MTATDDLLTRLFQAAREPCIETTTGAPYGFATRVAARWAERPRKVSHLPVWERVCRNTAVGMSLLALLVGIVAWQSRTPLEHDEDAALIAQLTEQVFLP
jgi:hypothetical protein